MLVKHRLAVPFPHDQFKQSLEHLKSRAPRAQCLIIFQETTMLAISHEKTKATFIREGKKTESY